jgi:hypothetical protein
MLLQLLQGLRAGGGEGQIISGIEGPFITQSKRRLVLDNQDAPAALCFGHSAHPEKPVPRAPGHEKLELGDTLTYPEGAVHGREDGKDGKDGGEGLARLYFDLRGELLTQSSRSLPQFTQKV